MNHSTKSCFLFVFMLSIGWNSNGLFGQDFVSTDSVVRGQPYKLFDGNTLEGWSNRNGKASKGWVVEDGALHRKSTGGDLYHEHFFRDFELTFEFKILKNGNSGVKYRVQPYGKQWLGCEFQVQDDRGRDFNKQASGGLYAIYEPSKDKMPVKLGEWNQAKIVVCGYRIQHWLNGVKTVDALVASSDWYDRVAKSKFNKHFGFAQNREGRIFLQDHGHPVWFRNIVAVPLSCSPSP